MWRQEAALYETASKTRADRVTWRLKALAEAIGTVKRLLEEMSGELDSTGQLAAEVLELLEEGREPEGMRHE